MAWFRLEGRGAFHHKVLAVGNEAYGAWCRAGQWSSDQLTDGLVPRAVAEQIAKPKVWAKLVEARLIHEAEGGYQIHDFLDFNPSSEEERARREVTREKRREAGKLGGIRSGAARRGEAQSNQPGSTVEANAKQSASAGALVLLEANSKQNEAPIPIPIPIENTDFVAGGDEAASGSSDGGEQMNLLGEPTCDAPRPAKKRAPKAPSPVTEVQTAWRAEWAAAGMPGPAPWGADAASVTKTYLDTPGASIETARAALVGMLRTPAGDWHRTEANGRYLAITAALAGKHVAAFTRAGETWQEAQRDAARPRRQPPPPAELPDFDAIKQRQQERLAQIRRPTETP